MKRREKLPKYHSFNGKKYQLKWRKPYKGRGICYDPSEKPARRVIMVDPKMDDLDFTETVIHEALHAEQWYLDEPTVQRIGENITLLLVKCGLIGKPDRLA